jgi:hypothetical protein
MSYRLRSVLGPLFAGAAMALASFGAQAVNCAIPSQRDATCVGSINNAGALPVSNSTLSTTLRGSNAIGIAGVLMPPASAVNECVSVPLMTWAYDPVSFATALPSFITLTGAGYLGAAGPNSPLDNCASDTDGSCTTWVPAAYPYLFTGSNTFIACGGANVLGSISCPVIGGSAYATTNPNAGWNFAANMIACKTGTATPSTVILGAPFSWWTNCTTSSQCSFYLVYPPTDTGGGGI